MFPFPICFLTILEEWQNSPKLLTLNCMKFILKLFFFIDSKAIDWGGCVIENPSASKKQTTTTKKL